MEAILIGIGGAFGAVLRYTVGQLLRSWPFPWATLIVNVLGSFILAVVLLAMSNDAVTLLIGVGFCGAFTTFATFSYQTVELWEEGRFDAAVVNASMNLILSLGGFGLGWLLFA